MSEYIDKQAVLHEMKMNIRTPFAVVMDFPPADVRQVVYGKWEHTHTSESYFNECWRCSACGFDDTEGFGFKFCPNCGADMRGGKP